MIMKSQLFSKDSDLNGEVTKIPAQCREPKEAIILR